MSEALRRLDLNLLVVFDALMGQRSVTRASERLGMTQPAVSNALGRLRHLLGDALFIRTGSGVIPTVRALELATPVRESLRLVETALAPAGFDASTAARTFRLALSDLAVLAIVPPLARRLAAAAPGIAIEVQPKTLPTVPNLLDQNQIDLAIGIFRDLPPRFDSRVVCRSPYLCLMRRNHALARGPMTLSAVARARHLSLRAVPTATMLIDELLARERLSRSVVLTVNQCAAIPEIIESSDLVVCLLEPIVRALPGLAGRGLVARRVRTKPAETKLVWHMSATEHAANAWLRRQILDVCAGIPAGRPPPA